MITRTTIRNFMGIENEITINCLASNKIKRNDRPFVITFDDKKILRTIGIIGRNGSGKTSILNALATVQTFVNFPFRKSAHDNQSFIENIKQLPKELLEQILDDFNNLKLPSANINHSNDDTFISIEMYIPEGKNKISGYYTYSLLYDYNYKQIGVKEEKLTYRNKYDSKTETIIFCVNNIIESELGTTLLYKNNNLNISKELIEYYDSIGDEIINEMVFIFGGVSINLKSFYDDHKDIFDNLCNLADEKIVKTDIEKNNDQTVLIFLNKNNKKLYFEQLSSGTQKIIILGCQLISAIEKHRLIFVDELENSLHPSLANFLVVLMQKLKKNSNSQMFFTTHSIELAMQLNNDQLYYIDNRINNYDFLSISEAIRKNIITKDKKIRCALGDNLLINNPDLDKIESFVENINRY